MPLFLWSPKYSVNVKLLDEQHQELIAVMNKLHDALLARQSKEVMGEIIEGLRNYVDVHFATEENLMSKYEYPGFYDHKQAHDEMREYVSSLSNAHVANRIIVSVEVMEHMKKWLAQHILGVDRMYQDFFNSEGVY